MILSEQSLALLKSLSRVSKSVYLEKGNVQRVASPNSTVVCEVTLEEEIPDNFGIYDLSALLNLIKVCDAPDIDFSGKSLIVTDTKNGMRAVFNASAKELINTVDSMDDILNADISLMFDLPGEVLKRMNELAVANSLTHIAFDDTPDGIIMRLFKKDVKDSGSITIPLTRDKKDDSLCIKTPFVASAVNMKVEYESYKVMIADAGFARLDSTNTKRRYIISTEMETE